MYLSTALKYKVLKYRPSMMAISYFDIKSGMNNQCHNGHILHWWYFGYQAPMPYWLYRTLMVGLVWSTYAIMDISYFDGRSDMKHQCHNGSYLTLIPGLTWSANTIMVIYFLDSNSGMNPQCNIGPILLW